MSGARRPKPPGYMPSSAGAAHLMARLCADPASRGLPCLGHQEEEHEHCSERDASESDEGGAVAGHHDDQARDKGDASRSSSRHLRPCQSVAPFTRSRRIAFGSSPAPRRRGRWPFRSPDISVVLADLTRGTGRYNVSLGAIVTMQGIGASLSNLLMKHSHPIARSPSWWGSAMACSP